MRNVALAMLCLTWHVSPGWSCGFCPSLQGNPLALPQPKAIEIAVATRAALDKGRIQPASLPSAGGSWNHRAKQSGIAILHSWVERANANQDRRQAGSFSMHIILIDTSESLVIQSR